jgi:hypothetical protein
MANPWDELKRTAQHISHGSLDIGQIMYPPQSNAAIAQELYEPTPEDWKEYERYLSEWEKDNPDPRLTGVDPQAPEHER